MKSTTEQPRKHVFVFGLNAFNASKLNSLDEVERYQFHSLLPVDAVKDADEYPFDELLREAQTTLEASPHAPDAIINFWDFPASVIHPILCRRYGLPSASLESVLKCGHKYWSRLEQKKVIPEHIPAFQVFDPFDERALAHIGLSYPFWIKPVQSYSGYLGFRINNEEDFATHIRTIRENIGRYANPWASLLEYIELPPDIAHVDGGYCLAEEIISGKQCTVEGYVHQGRFHTYGTIDSYRFANNVSFSRYQYPSRLPKRVKRKIREVSRRIMTHIGFNNSAFNIEYFYDRESDKLMLLEINPRISQSHGDLFEKVDGTSNHQIVVNLGLGEEPVLQKRLGDFKIGAKLFIRTFQDGVVKRIPSTEDIERVQNAFPGTLVVSAVKPGMRLSELLDQDSYSYQLAIIYTGANTTKELLANYDQCVKWLPFEIEYDEPRGDTHASTRGDDSPRVGSLEACPV